MDIDEVRRAKREMEYDILRFLSDMLRDFKDFTGEQVESVSVSFSHYQTVGSAAGDYRLSGVRVGVVL